MSTRENIRLIARAPFMREICFNCNECLFLIFCNFLNCELKHGIQDGSQSGKFY